MMKKLGLLFSMMLVMLFLVSCNKPVQIPKSTQEGLEEPILIDETVLAQMMDDQESFVLYVYSSTCSSCQEFHPILLDYISQTRVVIYEIEVSTTFASGNTLFPFEFTPTLGFFLNGEVVDQIDPVENEDPFTSLSELQTFMDQHFE